MTRYLARAVTASVQADVKQAVEMELAASVPLLTAADSIAQSEVAILPAERIGAAGDEVDAAGVHLKGGMR